MLTEWCWMLALILLGCMPDRPERTVTQQGGSWVIEYKGLTPPLTVALDAWVSNSRCPGHTRPLHLSIVNAVVKGYCQLIDEADDTKCKAVLSVSREDNTLRLTLQHNHVVYGDYDPLLGNCDIAIDLGTQIIRDQVILEEQHLAQPQAGWPTPPEDRRDTGLYLSPPDSLHLEAHIPGNQYYRFPERPVRYGTKMRLRFWYLIAAGTEGDCHARISQYKDTPTAWKVLSSGGYEDRLAIVGRWTKVERVFRTEDDATTLALDFRISSPCEVGEMWVDDVTLEPVGAGTTTGP